MNRLLIVGLFILMMGEIMSFTHGKLYKNGYVSNFNSRTVSAKDTLLLIIGKVDDESRKVIMADTVYCFPYVEK